MIRFQRTLKNAISCDGIGLHSGKTVRLTLLPALAGTGIVFVRTDLGGAVVRAISSNTTAATYATTLNQNGVMVRTVEHVLAALAGLGIDNAVIELDGEEVPIMDGSASPFVRLIADAGIRTQEELQPAIKIMKPVFVREGSKQVAIWPADRTSISYFIDFDHPLLREQAYNMQVSEESFLRDVSDARTFGFLSDVEMLRANGLAKGGSMENAVVLDEQKVLNAEGLRYRDEFVRHKILDLIGDLSLAGMPIIGHVVAHKSGHGLNARMVSKLLQCTHAWVLRGAPEAQQAARAEFLYPQSVAM